MEDQMRNLFVGLLVMCLFVLGFGVITVGAQEVTWTCPEGFEGQELNIFNWATYIDEEAIPRFEELCGVTVNYTTYSSNEEMIARLRQGNPGFDIVVPSGAVIPVMVADGLLEELDGQDLPNFVHVAEQFVDPDYDPGNTYTVPYQWGTVGIAYNKNAVGDAELTSWEDVFNYDGNVAWLEDQRAMLGVALQILGFDPNTHNLDEIEQARDFLLENGDNVVRIAEDDGQEMLLAGEADVIVEYNGDVFQIIFECECDDYAFITPEEGTNVWVDNLAIPTGAQNPELARVFIDYMLDPVVGAANSNYIAYASPNQTAIDEGLIDEELLTNPFIYPTEEELEKMFFILEDPDTEQLYSDAWDELSVLIGG
ncbi:MAG: ABC transporter substrate-binding protein [Phototrophicales bacterium]|nr:MAG: ABC transporter substrate-binding protein [Phototrophicales bacterium]